MNIKMLKAALAGLVLTVSDIASAGLITLDFDDFESNSAGYTYYASPFNTEGFQLTGNFIGNDYAIAGSGHIDYINSASLITFGDETHTLQQINASSFDLLSLDFTQINALLGNYNNLSFIGNLAGGGTVSQMINFDNIFNVQNIAFTGFTNLTSVQFSNGSSQALQIDNIVLRTTNVPEPSTLAIFALGIIGLASRRFKKK